MNTQLQSYASNDATENLNVCLDAKVDFIIKRNQRLAALNPAVYRQTRRYVLRGTRRQIRLSGSYDLGKQEAC
ncbi:hypothetical protein [Paenibacillus maysiensis]|uniref:hypothetical protein n=1 Tax=Paenibacillus maysiensis TaxID=1155954 RepID=UPI000472AC87|nr:hypothetical protein [Paenibacillus maysiensis]